MIYEVFFDVETKKFFDEASSFNPEDLGVSLVSVYKRELNNDFEEVKGVMQSFFENEIESMWNLFQDANRIIGFNSIKFDVPALKPYSPTHFPKLNHFDILDEIRKTTGRRISLNALSRDTLGRGKIDTGENAIIYYKNGDPESLALLKKYCEEDVMLTRDLYDFVLKNKYLKFKDHWNNPRQIEINFAYPIDDPVNKQIGLF